MEVTQETIRKVMAELGRRGGEARAQSMTAKQRRASAIKASKAAARARGFQDERVVPPAAARTKKAKAAK